MRQASWTEWGNEDHPDINHPIDNVTALDFYKVGYYKLELEGYKSAVIIEVDYPAFAFYKEPVVSEKNFLRGSYEYDADVTELKLYGIVSAPDGVTRTYDIASVDNINSYEEQESGSNIYKLTINTESLDDEAEIKINGRINNTYEDSSTDDWECPVSLNLIRRIKRGINIGELEDENNPSLYKVDDNGFLVEATDDDYSLKYDRENKKITLNNFVYESEGDDPTISLWDDQVGALNEKPLTLELIGTNSITSKNSQALFIGSDFTITGSGTLNAKSEGKVSEGEEGPWAPSAIFVNGQLKNYAVINLESNAEFDLEAWSNFVAKCSEDDDQTYQIINKATITGRVGLGDYIGNGLVSSDTTYVRDNQHDYLGIAYYYTEDDFYPNNICTLDNTEDNWRRIGKYDADGNPRPSHIWYQYYYVNEYGGWLTEDFNEPQMFLLYPEDYGIAGPESLLKDKDILSVGDGRNHTISNVDLYCLLVNNGNVTLNGNVISDLTVSAVAQRGDANEEGFAAYRRDEQGNILWLYESSPDAMVTVNGDVGLLSLYDSYKGSVDIQGNVSTVCKYDDINVKDYEAPDEIWYSSLANPGLVIDKGNFTDKVKLLDGFAGYMVYDTEDFYVLTQKGEDDNVTQGTCAPVDGQELVFDVSRKNGVDDSTYPCIKGALTSITNKVKNAMSNKKKNPVVMDIALIHSNSEKIEPTATVDISMDGIKGFSKPALYHIRDDGVIEKLFAYSGEGAFGGTIECKTDSFSTYFVAENQDLLVDNINTTPGGDSSGGAGGSGAGGGNGGAEPEKPAVCQHKNIVKVEEVPATCKVEGMKEHYVCADCDKWFSDDAGKSEIKDKDNLKIEKSKEHKPAKEPVKENEKKATCTEKGSYDEVIKCEICEAEISRETKETEMLKHEVTAIAAKEATCVEEGCKDHFFCANCGKYYADAEGKTEISKESVVFAKTEHKKVMDEDVAPTCEKDGKKGGSHCEICKEVLDAPETIKAAGHIFDAGKVTKQPTATATGVKTFTCTVCGKTKTESIPVIGKVQVGNEVKDEKTGNSFEVTNTSKKTVEYTGTTDKKATTVMIPATVEIGGVSYKVTKIEDGAFKNNKKLKKITVGENVTTIGKNAFKNCSSLVKITIPTKTKKIGDGAFEGCKKLKTVSIGKNTSSIGDNAFKNCESLTKITIPNKVNSVGASAFYGCKKLKTITISSTKLTSKNVDKNAFKGVKSGTVIKVPKRKLAAYKKLFVKKGLSKKVTIKGE
ncbi:MAG: leucine-rich repeat domain-containing protein [Eubacteriales bacterium]|nr:leucine-rich repeat domain-containing protein [Eubacteriales bacterium]